MPWVSTAISVGGSLLGGALGGSSKGAERAAKDAAARAQNMQEQQRMLAQNALLPYTTSGDNANRKLSELLGIADPSGYAPKPTLEKYQNELRNEHFQAYGKDYNRNSNMASINQRVDERYQKALQEWEAGRAQYEKANPADQSKATLLKNFTNEDFVKDPGYTFRMMEGEKGINRAQLARGGFDSGAALKEINQYNQDYASNEFGLAYNRDAANKARTFSMLSDTTGRGLNAVGAGIGSGQNAANNNSQSQNNLGNTLGQISLNNSDNQSNLIQSTIANLVYGYERNKTSNDNPYKTPDFNPYGSSTTRARDMFL